MEKAIEVIQARIDRYKNDILNIELAERDFVNSKYIKHLNALIKELETVLSELK